MPISPAASLFQLTSPAQEDPSPTTASTASCCWLRNYFLGMCGQFGCPASEKSVWLSRNLTERGVGGRFLSAQAVTEERTPRAGWVLRWKASHLGQAHPEYQGACSTLRHADAVYLGEMREVPLALPPGLDSVSWVHPTHVCWVCSDVGGMSRRLHMAPGPSSGLGVSCKCNSS